MFEYLYQFCIKKGENTNGKDFIFFPVELSSIGVAQERMGKQFPSELITFWKEIGYGFLGKRNPAFINRIMEPLDIADFMCNDEAYHYVDREDMYGEDDLVFLHISDEDFLKIHLQGEFSNCIFYFDTKIADSFSEFVYKMYQCPNYYIKK